MTLYINKEEGYGVFNTIEINLNYRETEALEKIYNAFIRGINTFVNVYNENNPEYPLHTITVGQKRNVLNNIF